MILGINGQNHDASMALIDGTEILWAAHAERYSRVKNDKFLNMDMVKEMYGYGSPDRVVWFEKPFSKSLRKLYSGERTWRCDPKEELARLGLENLPVEYVKHHESHAAAGFYTSGFSDAAILVVDAIGEWDTVSIWHGTAAGLKRVWNKRYPNSIGLFYTAFTQYLGLKPNEEEYILMGMAALGKPICVDQLKEDFFDKLDAPNFRLKYNLHQGCRFWNRPAGVSDYDIAASVQAITEEYLLKTAQWMKENIQSNNLIFMGGCALNCVANSLIANKTSYFNIWIMPNPGDAGSAVGAVAASEKKQLHWAGPYLGTDINRALDIDGIVKELRKGRVVAVANGRAEFGPRALGNRSLLCDPRGPDAKARMNTLKKREAFRPFAPAILAEEAWRYFKMPVQNTPYMQFVAECKDPNGFPGICHYDNTSRVQTVKYQDNPNFRAILELWQEKTGCPMLMNTSLNVKGEPLVNTWADAVRWQQINGVKVF